MSPWLLLYMTVNCVSQNGDFKSFWNSLYRLPDLDVNFCGTCSIVLVYTHKQILSLNTTTNCIFMKQNQLNFFSCHLHQMHAKLPYLQEYRSFMFGLHKMYAKLFSKMGRIFQWTLLFWTWHLGLLHLERAIELLYTFLC